MKSIVCAILTLLSLVVMGCGSSYRLRVDENSKELFLSFSKGSNVKAGDVFVLYKGTVVRGSGGGHNHGGSSQHLENIIVGKVRVIEIVDDKYASVKLLFGSAEGEVTVEKVE